MVHNIQTNTIYQETLTKGKFAQVVKLIAMSASIFYSIYFMSIV